MVTKTAYVLHAIVKMHSEEKKLHDNTKENSCIKPIPNPNHMLHTSCLWVILIERYPRNEQKKKLAFFFYVPAKCFPVWTIAGGSRVDFDISKRKERWKEKEKELCKQTKIIFQQEIAVRSFVQGIRKIW